MVWPERSVDTASPFTMARPEAPYPRSAPPKPSPRAYSARMARRIVVAGVAGSGKTTIGRLVADRLGTPFVDGDDLHSPASVAKMAGGTALTDADRAPWLLAVQSNLAAHDSVVIACSALRRRYRDTLREVPDVAIVLLDLELHEAKRRLEARPGHFMGSSMVGDQFETLELPDVNEPDVTVIDAAVRLDTVVDRVLSAVGE